MKKRTTSHKRIHVVAAVIENRLDQIFVAKRAASSHQGGLWEFPGGKVEISESPERALKRELFEELGIHITKFEPLIQISHDYTDKSILLDVWRVSEFTGKAHGKEGQETQWVDKKALRQLQFPAANQSIITAATLPQHYLITPEPSFTQRQLFLTQLEKKLKSGIRLFQLRAKKLSQQQLSTLYQEVIEMNNRYSTSCYINTSIESAQRMGASKIHLPSSELMNTPELPKNMSVSASCHSVEEIKKANRLGVDFIVISPVLKTASHPNSAPLNWDKFRHLCKTSNVPAFALGGMELSHLPKAIKNGAQGIAGIRSLWK